MPKLKAFGMTLENGHKVRCMDCGDTHTVSGFSGNNQHWSDSDGWSGSFDVAHGPIATLKAPTLCPLCARLRQKAYIENDKNALREHDAILDLATTFFDGATASQVADLLGVSTRWVQNAAAELDLGRRANNAPTFPVIYTPHEIHRILRPIVKPKGRPRKQEPTQ